MIATHEAYVATRFDLLSHRFKERVAEQDYRLRGVLRALGPLDGRRILDLGCGKGRFARELQARGATVIGLDLAPGMLSEAQGMPRVLCTARQLPFRSGTFDGAVAIEVFEHLDPRSRPLVIDELRRVLRPEGRVAIVDKNLAALSADRPWLPSVLVKWIDERRGRWMYPAGGPVREYWFWPDRLRRLLRQRFDSVRVEYLLSPAEERRWLFRRFGPARLMTLWAATSGGGCHV